MKEQSPEVIKLGVTVFDVTESRNGPDKSHPNLLKTVVGPESPFRVFCTDNFPIIVTANVNINCSVIVV